MNKQPVELPHDHLWDKWFPYRRDSKWRKCLHPKCGAVEIKKVNS